MKASQNEQRIFDRVWNHLLTQMKECRDEAGPRYRDDSGRRCAIGCLIDDEHYTPQLEGRLVREPSVLAALASSGFDPNVELRRTLLSALQCVHDCNSPDYWESELCWVARRYGLSTPSTPGDPEADSSAAPV